MVNETKLQSPYGQLDDCLKITNEQSTEVVYNFGDILELDREYTFSCWFRADSEIQISIQISNERSRYFPVTSEWQKVSFTASANTATSKKVFFTIPANNTLYAYEGMLELGNIASDFKPSEKDIENVVTTLQTNFTVQQGKIESLIKETTIDNGDGTTTSLKDAYNQTKQTVEGNTTTIANVQTKVNDLTGDVESMDYRITTVETTADGLKTTVSKASSDASSALTSANQTASKFSWIVESGSSATDFTLTNRTASLVADYINLNGKVTFSGLDSSAQNKINTAQSTANTANSKIDNLEIGGRNLMLNTQFFKPQFGLVGAPEIPTKDVDGFYYVSLRNTWSNYIYQYIDLALGQTYMISFYAKCDSNAQLEIKDDSINNVALAYATIDSKDWKLYSTTFVVTTKKDIPKVTFLTRQDLVTIHIKKIKLELGNKATDWTPAPEDKANQSIIDNWAKDSIVGGETTINGGYIKTNTIKTDQLAVDDIFATGSAAMNIINAQEINANRITSGQLSAERINVYGLSVLNKDNNQQTFNIANNGEVTIKGSVSSSNYNIGKTGWSINNDGTAEFNDIIARGSVITNDGGIVSAGGSGRNLFIKENLLTYGVNSYSWNGYILSCDGKGGCGIKLPSSLFTVGETYALSFKFKKTDGTLINIGGHMSGFEQLEFSVDNSIVPNEYTIGYPLDDSTDTHSVYVILKYIGGANDDNLYVQVNRLLNIPIKFDIWDIKLEKGSVATDWSLAPEDKTKQVRFWAGSSYEDRESAPFIVYNDGSIRATQGEYSGLWTGDIKIGNISIVDPSSQSGNDALVTIQNGANGIKRVQLTDNTSSCFAQDIIITNNTYSPMISLKQDGSAYYSKGINIADKTTLNSTSLIINNKTLTTTSNGSGFLFNNELNVGTANQSANLIVHGNVSTDNITVDSTLYFGDVLKFTKNANGINIDFI